MQKKLKILNWEQQNNVIEKYIRKQAKYFEQLKILEAGCGRRWPFSMGDVRYHLTGVDLDKRALNEREKKVKDLDVAIVGDLCSIELPIETFDIIYSSFVLEHIKEADIVLKKFSQWVKKNGVIIIKVPDPNSVGGFITRVTPFWFHVLFYRYILRIKKAGKPGFGPYHTYYHPIISREGIRNFCKENNFEIEGEYGYGNALSNRNIIQFTLSFCSKVINASSLYKLSADHKDILYLIRKL